MSREQFNPNWPAPVELATDRPERDMVNLSRLDTNERRQAFERLQREEPGIADFVRQMHRSFGKSTLYVDKATAERLGAKPDD